MGRTFPSFFFAILAIIFLLSCEKTLNIKNAGMEPKIVLNGIIQPDSFIEIRASKSFPYHESYKKSAYLPNVVLKIYVNGEFKEEMPVVSAKSNETVKSYITLFRSTFRASIGDKIRIEAAAPDIHPAWVETQIPQPPVIEKVDTSTFITQEIVVKNPYSIYLPYIAGVKRESFYRNMRLRIALQAEKKQEQQFFYIHLRSLYGRKFFEYNPLPIYTQDDPAFANNPQNSILNLFFEKNSMFNGSQIFTDKLFKNNTYVLDITTTNFYPLDYEIKNDTYDYTKVRVLNPPIEIWAASISKEMYQFLKSQEQKLYDDDAMDIISEPHATYSNVINGIGFVGATSSVKKRIELPPFSGGKNMIPKQ